MPNDPNETRPDTRPRPDDANEIGTAEALPMGGQPVYCHTGQEPDHCRSPDHDEDG